MIFRASAMSARALQKAAPSNPDGAAPYFAGSSRQSAIWPRENSLKKSSGSVFLFSFSFGMSSEAR